MVFLYSNYPQQPHGGKLINRVVSAGDLEQELVRAKTLPQVMVDQEAVITIEMIATGVLSPNEGFMNEDDYKAVLYSGRLANGLIWPVPLSFAPSGSRNAQVIATLKIGDEITIINEEKEPIALMEIQDIFKYAKEERALCLFGTTDRNHPGVDAIYRRMGEISLGGPITLLQRADWGPFEKHRLEPKDTWRLFYEEKQFSSVAGFITGANPVHRGHEYIHKNALETIDGLLIQPLVEMTKREYTRNEYRILAYRAVLDTYYPKGQVTLAPLRVTYIFAGPRETVLHALVMKNYGCTHALIGRDHAGVGDYYDKYACHNIFGEFTPEELGLEVRLYNEVFYCTRCAGVATAKTCPHDERFRIAISGTGIRELLRRGIMPPKEICRPESSRIAMQGIQPKGVDEEGNSIYPVGKTIKGIFPYYLSATRLGGRYRYKALLPEELSERDLEAAVLDARLNADRIYSETYAEFTYVGDSNRNLQPQWVTDAREQMKVQQQMVITDLEEKAKAAPGSTSDEFMYQDQKESDRELEVAREILRDIPRPLHAKEIRYRTWNPLPYQRYKGVDKAPPAKDSSERQAKSNAG